MNKIEELERDLTVAYLNYENDDLKETLKYLDRMLALILNDDKSLENDPFWKTLTCDVFKAIVLNNFYNKKELIGNDLDSLLENEEMMKKNIKEFCDNFRDNDSIDFISHIENIAENSLKDVIKILMTNIGKMNIKDIKIEISKNNEAKESKIQKIDCFCGKSFEFDWSKIPDTEKTIYMKCPSCDSELKMKNPYCDEMSKEYNYRFYYLVKSMWDNKYDVSGSTIEKMIDYSDYINNEILNYSYKEVFDGTDGQEASEGLYKRISYNYEMDLLGSIFHANIGSIKTFLSFSLCKGQVDEKWFNDIEKDYLPILSIKRGELVCRLIKKLHERGFITSTNVIGQEVKNWDTENPITININYDDILTTIINIDDNDFNPDYIIKTNIENYLKNNTEMSKQNVLETIDKLFNSHQQTSLLSEFYYTMQTKKFPKNPQTAIYIKTNQYTAEKLYNTGKFSIIGAYNYLIYLKEKPEEALKDLEEDLPNK